MNMLRVKFCRRDPQIQQFSHDLPPLNIKWNHLVFCAYICHPFLVCRIASSREQEKEAMVVVMMNLIVGEIPLHLVANFKAKDGSVNFCLLDNTIDEKRLCLLHIPIFASLVHSNFDGIFASILSLLLLFFYCKYIIIHFYLVCKLDVQKGLFSFLGSLD